MDPKTEGVFAFHASIPADRVPYNDELRRSAWMNGWRQAERVAAQRQTN